MSIGVPESGTEGNGGNGSVSQAGFAAAGAFGQDSLFQCPVARPLDDRAVRRGGRGRRLFYLQMDHAAVCRRDASSDRETPPRPGRVSPASGGTPVGYAQTEAEFIRSRSSSLRLCGIPNVLTLPTLRSKAYPIEKVTRTLTVSVTRNTNIVNVTAMTAYPETRQKSSTPWSRPTGGSVKPAARTATDELLKNLNEEYEYGSSNLSRHAQARLAFEKENPEVMASIRGGIIRTSLEELKKESTQPGNVRQEWESFYEGIKRFEFDSEGMRVYIHNYHDAEAVREDEGKRTRLSRGTIWRLNRGSSSLR